MKLDVKLDKDDEGDIKFSMDCDKEFSDIVNECMEGWSIIIRDAITFYGNMRNPTAVYPTEVHTIRFPEKEVVIEEDKEKKADDNSTSRDIIHTDTSTSGDITTDPGINGMGTGTDPPIPDPVGKGDVDADTSEWNGKTTHAPSK